MGSRNTYFLAVGLGLVLGLSCTRPVRADHIAIVLDQHGHKMYINTGEIPKGSTQPITLMPPRNLVRLVERAASKHQVDPELVHAIIQVESAYNPNAVSRKGALGLMQLIPATARRFGVQNAFDPAQNIEGGVNYLKQLIDFFGGDLSLSLAAYNAGENSVLRNGGVPLYQETRAYVRRVTGLYGSDFTKANGPGKWRPRFPIRRYIDSEGRVHFSNVD